MKKSAFFFVFFLVGFFILALIINKIGSQEIIKTLTLFRGLDGIRILVVTILIVLVGTWKLQFILNSQGFKLPFFKLGEISLASFAVTYLFTPTAIVGGEGFKAYITKKEFSVPWEKALASIAIEKILSITLILPVSLLGIILFVKTTNISFGNIALFGATIIAALTILILIFYFKSFKKESIISWFLKIFGIKRKENEGWFSDFEKEIFQFFEPKKRVMWQGLLITLFQYFLILLRCWLIVFSLKEVVGFLMILVIFIFTYVAYLFPFPAGMGSLEAIQAFVFKTLGLGAATGITFSLILRGADLLSSLFGILFLAKWGTKLLETNF